MQKEGKGEEGDDQQQVMIEAPAAPAVSMRRGADDDGSDIAELQLN